MKERLGMTLTRYEGNPILSSNPANALEDLAVFNTAVRPPVGSQIAAAISEKRGGPLEDEGHAT